jgi:hypothetical protein
MDEMILKRPWFPVLKKTTGPTPTKASESFFEQTEEVLRV